MARQLPDDDIRAYAAGNIAWRDLQQRGWDHYGDVLMALGRLGLRYPVLGENEGLNVESRARARAWLSGVLPPDGRR
jgi:hypothetical protein